MASDEAEWAGQGLETEDGAQDQHSDEEIDNNAQDSNDSDEEENGSDDGGDYDPESVSFDAPTHVTGHAGSATPSQTQPSKPKKSGGFIMEASDDDDDDEVDSIPNQGNPNNQYQPAQSIVSSAPAQNGSNVVSKPNLPTAVTSAIPNLDPVSLLEIRIKEDPRGDMDAWLTLILEYKGRGLLDKLRDTYRRLLEVFPQAAEMWAEWAEMELGMDEFMAAENIFGNCLLSVPNVKLWTVYLNYIRRRNDLTNDLSGQARRTVSASYEFVIDNIGMDRDSGHIWQDYLQFIKSGPGDIHGSGWQDKQKMDQLRKAYHRAVAVPMTAVNTMWKEYDQFEMGLNKATGRKLIQERSPGYMTAKSASMALDNITRNLNRTTLPRLPPALGFSGDEEYKQQVELWRRLIAWEKDDPLVLKDDEPAAYQQRVLYCHKQALMAMRFCPEIWVETAEWCNENNVKEEEKPAGTEMLLAGIKANPESVLLALKHAEHIEAHYPAREGEKSQYAKAVRQPYDTILNTLYAQGDKLKEREKMEVATMKQAASQDTVQLSIENAEYGEEDGQTNKSPMEGRITAIQKAYATETQLLSRTISYIWIALARAMRRIEGKGNQTEAGLRKVFTDARQKGRLTSDVYVAVALLESIVYKDPVGAKIFERGARLFPSDESFMIEYLKFLHSKDDTTNARVVFEQCVNRLIANPDTLHKAKPLYAYFHGYESQYGELSQISKLEDRMAELFPEDPKLKSFTARFASDKFDPIAAPIIISKAVQMRPKAMQPPVMQQISVQNSPFPARQTQSPQASYIRVTASPKRPFGNDDDELNPPKRQARGVSPLKGAAGRRLDQQRRNQASALHRDITFLLGILPPAHSYDAARMNTNNMVGLLREAQVPDYNTWKSKTGGRPLQAPAHSRQTSNDYGNRPMSPYGRLSGTSGGYRNSPLRTEQSSAMYSAPETNPAPQSWLPPAGFGQSAPARFPGYQY